MTKVSDLRSKFQVDRIFQSIVARSAYSIRELQRTSVRVSVRPSVRDLGDFCEGYKRPGQGHIRLDNFSEICPRFILVTLTNRD